MSRPKPAGDGYLRLSGDGTFTYGLFDGVIYGQVGGEQMIAQHGDGENPDVHYGTCTKSDPWSSSSTSGHFILFDGRSGQGIAQHHVVTAFEYLPSASSAPATVSLSNGYGYGNPALTSLMPAPLTVDYPVTQGDAITFTNLDTHAHTVTSCADPCTEFVPTKSGAFDGDIHLAGDQYTIDTSQLAPGTYHYFCEIHPYMRGSFTVKPESGAALARGR